MERGKLIFSDKPFRRQAVATLFFLFFLLLAGQLLVSGMAQEFKKSMIEHDYAVVGYLSREGVEDGRITAAFTQDKTNADIQKGASLLNTSGYSAETNNSLLPTVERFHRKYSLTVFFFLLFFSFALLCAQFYGVLHREKQLEDAARKLWRFMEGDTSVRLEDCAEGTLSRLFSAVNAMATSLTAHIDREKQSRQFLKEMISDISHQIKTPLAALSMYSEIIREENGGSGVTEEFSKKSSREIERMENLISNLLRLARLDAGAIKPEREIHRLYDFLENRIASFVTRAEQEEKSISLTCGDAVTLRFDETWLGEAVGNIIKNALDHTEAKGRIEISCEDTAVLTEIVIRDNGAGIHPEDIHHVFKRFYRSRFSKDKTGVGIGLSLSKAIVELHGGTVAVSSKLGEGAEFHMIFPKLTNL